MPFQSQVNINLAFGVPGELLEVGPQRAESLIVNSGGANPNTVGYAYTKDAATNIASVGGETGAGRVFAGILANPKVYASYGGPTGTLAPTLAVPDNAQGEFLTMGTIVAHLASAANIGDHVCYDTATGALSAVASGAAAPEGLALVPNAVVHRYPVTAAAGGLTAIRLTN
jgi:hypothetical protein